MRRDKSRLYKLGGGIVYVETRFIASFDIGEGFVPVNKISIAPMLDLTTRHCRYLYRLMSREVLLYSEMVATGAIIYGDRKRVLDFDACEHPLALQLAGSKPDELAQCAKIGAEYGYDEINLNVGCPSSRVQAGGFGACLLLESDLVVDCVAAMVAVTDVPVTVKTRLGIRGETNFNDLCQLVERLIAVGCQKLIVHAREAKLQGMSPRQNRSSLPLAYDNVYDLKAKFPELPIVINGEIASYEAIAEHLQYVDGVMLGRSVYRNPYLLAEIDQCFYGSKVKVKSREQIADEYIEYVAGLGVDAKKRNILLKPLLGLYRGVAGASSWRKALALGFLSGQET